METKVWIIGGSIVAGIVLLVVTVTISIPVYIKFCRNKCNCQKNDIAELVYIMF